ATAAEFARAIRPAGAPTPASVTAVAPAQTQPLPAQNSIAVLPFANMSPDADTEYFSDGMTEEIINALTKLRSVHVAARTSAFAFKGKNADLETVGKKLNVRLVLEGSVRRQGNKLRVTTRLIDVAKGVPMWSERFDRQMEDVFAIQDEISQAVVDTLRITVLREPEESGPKRKSENVEAFEFYLKGRYFFSHGGLGRALTFFEQAARRDPAYAVPHAGIADCYFALANLSYLSPREGYERARSAAQAALALDETLAEAHAAIAIIKCNYDWDWEGARREFERALELNPGLANAHYMYSLALSSHGLHEEALAHGERACSLDPLNRQIVTGVARAHLVGRRFELARKALEDSLSLEEPDVSATHGWLAVAHIELGNFDSALIEAKRALALAEIPIYVALLGYVSARAGFRDDALAVLSKLKEKPLDVAVFQAWIYVGLGDIANALEWMEKAFQERSDWLIIIAAMPVCDPLRNEPRFNALVGKLGIEASDATRTGQHIV
ncbi:MAG: tetratricopeptide repeat protein, partial [Gemmatimonadota bacterium]|nr:tetratricopeptide repeat protein [Gemmatimonadota bacterium]